MPTPEQKKEHRDWINRAVEMERAKRRARIDPDNPLRREDPFSHISPLLWLPPKHYRGMFKSISLKKMADQGKIRRQYKPGTLDNRRPTPLYNAREVLEAFWIAQERKPGRHRGGWYDPSRTMRARMGRDDWAYRDRIPEDTLVRAMGMSYREVQRFISPDR